MGDQVRYNYPNLKKTYTPDEYYRMLNKIIYPNRPSAQRVTEIGRLTDSAHLGLVPIVIEECDKWLLQIKKDFENNPLKTIRNITQFGHKPLVDLLAIKLDDDLEADRRIKIQKIQAFFNSFAEIALRPLELGRSGYWVDPHSKKAHSWQDLAFDFLNKSIQLPFAYNFLTEGNKNAKDGTERKGEMPRKIGEVQPLFDCFSQLVEDCNEVALVCFSSYDLYQTFTKGGYFSDIDKTRFALIAEEATKQVNTIPITLSRPFPQTNIDSEGHTLRFYSIKAGAIYVMSLHHDEETYAAQDTHGDLAEAKAEILPLRFVDQSTYYDIEEAKYFGELDEEAFSETKMARCEASVVDDKLIAKVEAIQISHAHDKVHKAIQVAQYTRSWAESLANEGVSHQWVLEDCDSTVESCEKYLNPSAHALDSKDAK